MKINVQIDGKSISVEEGLPVRKAALKNGIYIPGLCGHPYLPPVRNILLSKKIYRGSEEIAGDIPDENTVVGELGNCGLCLVSIEGESELKRACEYLCKDGTVVNTTGSEISTARKKALSKILATHPHSCLTCAQHEGCSLTQCSSNVPEDERCCVLLNRCELGKVVEYVGFPEDVPKYVNEKFPKIFDDPFFNRDYNLCINCLRCVRICRDVRGVDVLGVTLKDGRLWVGTKEPGGLTEAHCRFCGACVEVCPTGALLDKPDSRPVKKGESPPCIDACPAGIDIPAYVRLIAENDFKGALNVIYERVPFPGILGFVCFHPCEEACKREQLDGGVSICALKRFVYENAKDQIGLPQKQPSSGRSVAIVGAGPAGLSAAYYLALAGHNITIYDTAAKPGGMLRNAIPRYRLPEEVLEDELKQLYDLGVEFVGGKTLGKDLKISDLQTGDFDIVLITIGLSSSKKLGIEGEDLKGIYPALDLLKKSRSENPPSLNGKVVVIGGGNVAVDSAMTAVRLGAKDVTLVCLENREEIPAHKWELQQAFQEGVKVMPGWGPLKLESENGKVSKVHFRQCTSVFDSSGRFAPKFNDSETFSMDANFVIIAIGQEINADASMDFNESKLGAGAVLKVDDESFSVLSNIYAAGDVISGPTSVINAIASGRKAADAIDKKLGGTGIKLSDTVYADVRNNPHLGRDESFIDRGKIKSMKMEPDIRVAGFDVIEKSLTIEDATCIAQSCLRCHLRAAISAVILPPDKWMPLTWHNIDGIDSVEGVYQIADAAKKVVKIVGSSDIKTGLQAEVDKYSEDVLFCWEEDRMYSKRESELIQQHLQAFGEMPGGGDDELDDLF